MNTMTKKPLIMNRADPWIYRHSDGFYYFAATLPEYNAIELRKAATLTGLADAQAKIVWTKHEAGKLSQLIWAPELHFIDGKWYIYFAAAWLDQPINGIFDHRMFVLETDASDPLEGNWIEKGQLVTNWESFSLDATTFEHGGCRYLVWAQKDSDVPGHSNLYIAKMDTPWSIEGRQVCLTKPELDWECVGFLVNEGPAVLKRGKRIFITYSASATDHNYCMGMLTAGEDADLLDPSAWHKSQLPVFESNEQAGIYGPGHNSFTVSEDGKDDILVYHARSFKITQGDPLNDPNRHTFVKKFGWHPDGMPDFGNPK